MHLSISSSRLWPVESGMGNSSLMRNWVARPMPQIGNVKHEDMKHEEQKEPARVGPDRPDTGRLSAFHVSCLHVSRFIFPTAISACRVGSGMRNRVQHASAS